MPHHLHPRSTTLTREQLYELVWQTPMIRLAGRFGISDVGLSKICRRLEIPTPPVGWWAKKAAGRKVRTPPLPEAPAGMARQVIIEPTPPETSSLRNEVRKEAERLGPIAVPERLSRPHPIIARWIEQHRQRQDRARSQRDPWRRNLHNVPDCTAAERRRHRILDALFRALEREGATVAEDERGELVATLQGEEIPFALR